MHEWALAEAVIASALGVADKEGLNRVTEVVLKVGELQEIELEILEFAFSQLLRGKLEIAEFKTGMAKAEFQCYRILHLFNFGKTLDAISLACASGIPICTANPTFFSIFSCRVMPSSRIFPF